MSQEDFNPIYPTQDANAPLDNSEEPDFQRCRQCGMPLHVSKTAACPDCGSLNFK